MYAIEKQRNVIYTHGDNYKDKTILSGFQKTGHTNALKK